MKLTSLNRKMWRYRLHRKWINLKFWFVAVRYVWRDQCSRYAIQELGRMRRSRRRLNDELLHLQGYEPVAKYRQLFDLHGVL